MRILHGRQAERVRRNTMTFDLNKWERMIVNEQLATAAHRSMVGAWLRNVINDPDYTVSIVVTPVERCCLCRKVGHPVTEECLP
jgi:hypothetical protein